MRGTNLTQEAHERDKILRDRLELIRQRHRKLILEPRKMLSQTIDTDVFFEDDDEFDSFEHFDFDFTQDQESELF